MLKVEKLDHVHIFVKDMEKAKELFSRILGTTFSPVLTEEKVLKIDSSLSPLGIELIASAFPDSAVSKTIEHRGEGLAGLSFKVSDLEQATAYLESQGLRPIGKIEMGKIKEVQFHPADVYGVLLELCQYEEQHGAFLAAIGV